MPRLNLKLIKDSRLPRVIGVCADDTPSIADAVNAAHDRLFYSREGGNEGWHGTWARMAFNVYRTDPYITCPRHVARLEDVNICRSPAVIRNEFWEFTEFGTGLLPKTCSSHALYSRCSFKAVYDRGMYPLFRDLSTTGGLWIRVRAVDPLDGDGTKRTLISGLDVYDTEVTTQDGATRVRGEYVSIVDPFITTTTVFKSITGIQKDVTNGPIQFWEVDPATGDEILVLTMDASETIASYRRYYLHGLSACCGESSAAPVQVEAIVKLNPIPVAVDSDYLVLQNLEAIIAECQSARYATMDIAGAKLMAAAAHKDAINYLKGELAHHYGTSKPTVTFHPFGSARLERHGIGTLI
jgi:hypothetical protein